MRVEFHNRLGSVERREATRLTVYDSKDNPVVVAIEFAPGMIFAATAEHEDFNHILKMFGIDKTVIVQPETPPLVPDLRTVSFE